MRAIGLAPRIEQRDDRVALVGEQAMHGPCTGALVFELAGFAAFIPAPRAALGELEVLAHATMAPARPGRLVDQAEQTGSWWPRRRGAGPGHSVPTPFSLREHEPDAHLLQRL